MFSLIISIIAIALVAALALASIYYGGSAFQEGSAEAEASTVVNQGQQIAAALTMADVAEYDLTTANSDHDAADELTVRLVAGNFLKESPKVRDQNWLGMAANGTTSTKDGSAELVVVTVNSDAICDAIEEKFTPGFDSDSTHSAFSANAFGCTSGNVAYFKL